MQVRTLSSDNSGENIKLHWDLLDTNGKSVSNGLYNALIIINGKVYKKPLLIVK
jgi:hypothetical protein